MSIANFTVKPQCLLLALCVLVLHPSKAQSQVLEHNVYDTEFGRFDLWILGDQLTGSYEIAPKSIIGSMWATLDGSTATGRWTDPDGSGDIVLVFEDGFRKFSADYRSDDNPDKWYRDQWHGDLRTADGSDETPCSGASHDLIKPFIGTWEEFELDEEGKEEFIGTLQVQLGAGGCSLLQRFTGPDSNFFYTTQGYVDGGSGFWEERYVFSTGATADYRWVIDDGDVVQRRVGGSRQISHLHQLRFTELDKSGYLLLQEQSNDGGRTWEVTGRTRVRRQGTD